MRGKFQMIFQDPYGSLNPRMSIFSILEEALKLHTKLDAAGRDAAPASLTRIVDTVAPTFEVFGDTAPAESAGPEPPVPPPERSFPRVLRRGFPEPVPDGAGAGK